MAASAAVSNASISPRPITWRGEGGGEGGGGYRLDEGETAVEEGWAEGCAAAALWSGAGAVGAGQEGCEGGVAWPAREGDDLPDVVQAGGEEDEPLEAQPEAGVRHVALLEVSEA
ncbi:hypothetical protein TSOC_010460 [Tetrabaena socialis]|uniref:Uncharacterized protein n=1 Tax=Tetrabaena socialis TaxID=47790 RepID=A0A2J7ZT98_9CHLO|nr:hypothetical protein TSOC_010460 [Tetrabaena socialis]|eukprot:PNH03495.1 hypothetical protein TSOC_010460 [Tetrabaena socialis]